MPRIASTHAELLDEAQRRLETVKTQLANPSTATLVAAQQQLDVASELLNDSYEPSETWMNLDYQLRELQDKWSRACGHSEVRKQVFRALARPNCADVRDVVIGVSCYAREPFGDVVLAALNARRNLSSLPSLYHVLWLPVWVLPRLTSSGLLDIMTISAAKESSREEAEVVASLWTPTVPGSPYATIDRSFQAARAVLNGG